LTGVTKLKPRLWTVGLAVPAVAVAAILVVAFLSGPRRKGRENTLDAVEGAGARGACPEIKEATAAPAGLASPGYVPAGTRDPALAALVDRNAPARVTGDITTALPRVQFEEDVPAVVAVLKDTEDEDTVRNEAANLLLRSGYDGLVGDLTGILANPDEKPRFRSFCVQKLLENARQRPQDCTETVAVLRGLLEDRDVPVRREALLALVRMRDPKGRDTAIEWLLDERVEGVRDAAIRCVTELGLREHIPTVRKHLRDKDEVVCIAAIVTLSAWGDEESRPAIQEAARSDSFRLRRCAEMALRRLDRASKAGGSAEPDENAPESAPPKAGADKPAF